MVPKQLPLYPMGTMADVEGTPEDVCPLPLGKGAGPLMDPFKSTLAILRTSVLGYVAQHSGLDPVVEATARPTSSSPSHCLERAHCHWR